MRKVAILSRIWSIGTVKIPPIPKILIFRITWYLDAQFPVRLVNYALLRLSGDKHLVRQHFSKGIINSPDRSSASDRKPSLHTHGSEK